MPSPGLWPAPTTMATRSCKRMSVHSRDWVLLQYLFNNRVRCRSSWWQARGPRRNRAADAAEGQRHVGRVDQKLVQIGVALEQVAIFGNDLLCLQIGRAGHLAGSPLI